MKVFNQITWLQWLIATFFVLMFIGTLGLASGYRSGVQDREQDRTTSRTVEILDQYEMGMADYEAGNYTLALQRFEYIVQQDPNFPGVVNMLSETMLRISEHTVSATAIPTATPTPAPTVDSSMVEALFTQAEIQFQNQEWELLVETITTLRDAEPLYRAKDTDRMLFLALYFSGIDKILNEGNLEGGVYDFSLVERFAPLAAQGRIYQEWARLYQIGVSFWGIFPDKAVYYFSQLTSTAPYLHDLSGFYARDRYRLALEQYGDHLSHAGEWCLALEQYQLANGLLEEPALQPTLTYVETMCSTGQAAPTTEPEPDPEWTPTPFETLLPTLTVDPENTPTPEAEETPVPTNPPVEPTATPEPTLETPPTEAPPEPTPTPEPTS